MIIIALLINGWMVDLSLSLAFTYPRGTLISWEIAPITCRAMRWSMSSTFRLPTLVLPMVKSMSVVILVLKSLIACHIKTQD